MSPNRASCRSRRSNPITVWARCRRAAANPPTDDLATNIARFCGILRGDHGFAVGQRETYDALRAIDAIGVADRGRVRSALRLVCCGTRAQTLIFDRAFDAFFDAPSRGVTQPANAVRHTRPGHEKPPSTSEPRPSTRRPPAAETDDDDGGATCRARQPAENTPDDATAWQLLRARYSPTPARGDPPHFDPALAAAMRSVAQRLIQAVRLGRSRRWKAGASSGRFDIRRTLRASLRTGGDPVLLWFLGHPRRNPRFVVLIDGSRSMAGQTAAVVAFAAALCERTARADVFFFSTALHDVTRAMRATLRTGVPPRDLGEAWGGGTQIGANLARFEHEHGARLLSPDTLVIIFSDGLDVGDVAQLERAMRDIDQRSAGIVWLNPHVATPGYSPVARGMRAALPFVTLLGAADDTLGFERLVERIGRTPRIRGRRR